MSGLGIFGVPTRSLTVLPTNPNSTMKILRDDIVEKVGKISGEVCYRIGTIHGSGNSFFHCLLKTFSQTYSKNNTISFRDSKALSFRISLIASIASDYDILGGGSYSKISTVIKNFIDPNFNEIDLSLSSLIKHLTSVAPLTPYLFKYISSLLEIGIYMVERVSPTELELLWVVNEKDVNIIMIPLDSWARFELFSVRRGDILQTAFRYDDPIIKSISL